MAHPSTVLLFGSVLQICPEETQARAIFSSGLVAGVGPKPSGLLELMDRISSYVTFCEESVIPRKSITIFPNNKSQISKSVKNIIHMRNISFNNGDRPKHVLHPVLKIARLNYKDRAGNMFRSNNSVSLGGGSVHDGDADQKDSDCF